MAKQRARSASWDLRVACALISLDVVDPFLGDLGFDEEDGVVARRVAREHLAIWDSQDPEAWLSAVRKRDGEQVANGIAQLSAELALPRAMHFSWVSLMVELEGKAGGGQGPRIEPDNLAWFKKAASQYLAESGHLHEQLDHLDYRLSRWDAQFLVENFFPADGDDDEAARFDPRSWLWAVLDKRHWEQFQQLLRTNLSGDDLDELVSWGNRVLKLPWLLSASLTDGGLAQRDKR